MAKKGLLTELALRTHKGLGRLKVAARVPSLSQGSGPQASPA